jgi:peptide/nickel transport system substrate-binding protein
MGFFRALAFAAWAVTAAASPALAQDAPKRGGTLTYGMVTEVASLDPHVYSGSSWKVVNHALYSSLLGFDASGKIVPALAERWEVSADAKTYTFMLRSGVTFHKGQKLTAQDVKYSFDRILDAATGATLRGNLQGMTIAVVDDHTVRITLAEPDTGFLNLVALPEAAIVSEAWMKGNPNVKAEANGTGPFVLAEYEPKVRALVKRNPNYFVKDQPRLDQVVFRMISNGDARVNALRTGATDMIEFVPWKDIDMLKQQPGIEVQTAGGAFMNLWLNSNKPPFNNPKVRQALNYAVDREAISKAAYFGHGTPLAGPPNAGDTPFFNEDLAKAYTYDPAKAKALMAEAGLANGFETEMVVFQGLSIYTTTAQILQSNLKDIGINTKIKLSEWANVVEAKDKGQYELMIWGVSVKLPGPDAYSYYFSSDSTYWAKPIGYVDRDLDRILRQARSTVDVGARKALYRSAEERIVQTSPWVFINWRDQAQAYRSKIKGYVQLGGALSESSPGIVLPTMWIAN